MQYIGNNLKYFVASLPVSRSVFRAFGLLVTATILPSPEVKAQGPVYSIPPYFSPMDSGGGKVQIGTMTNHGSIGASVASGTHNVGTASNRNGLIQVLYSVASTPSSDANGNGLPDAWEQQYFPGQTVGPLKDSDGDGTNNRMEYIAGTNPTDRTSVFKPTGTYTSGIFSMPIQTVIGRTYKVYATKDLSTWHLQQSYTGDGTSKTYTFDETAVPSGPLHSQVHPSSYFFRVEVILP